MKVYMEKTEFSKEVNSESISQDYDEIASSLARMIGQIEEYRSRAHFLSELAKDNGDVYLEMDDALRVLGGVLATTICYKDEYHDEALGKEQED